MHKLLIAFCATALSVATGCEGKKNVEVNAPGVQVRSGEAGTEIKTPNTEVDVKH